MVADVCAEDTQGDISVSGVLQAVLRYQGIVLSDRNDLSACTQRIFAKVDGILDKNDDDEDETGGQHHAGWAVLRGNWRGARDSSTQMREPEPLS
eukprot:COSAG01_NODE_44060_length_423_cov_0.574074_1_plen_95_part_00